MVTHEIDREDETFEELAFQSVEYTAFLNGNEKNRQAIREAVPSSLVIDLPPP